MSFSRAFQLAGSRLFYRYTPSLTLSATARITPSLSLRHTRMLSSAQIMSSASAPYKSVSTDKAPSAIGPYVQATVHNGTIYCSGCIPFDPKTMTLVEGGIEAQTQRALDNLLAVVEAAGGDKSTVLKTSVFLKDVSAY